MREYTWLYPTVFPILLCLHHRKEMNPKINSTWLSIGKSIQWLHIKKKYYCLAFSQIQTLDSESIDDGRAVITGLVFFFDDVLFDSSSSLIQIGFHDQPFKCILVVSSKSHRVLSKSTRDCIRRFGVISDDQSHVGAAGDMHAKRIMIFIIWSKVVQRLRKLLYPLCIHSRRRNGNEFLQYPKNRKNCSRVSIG